jgi:hypothetical protein
MGSMVETTQEVEPEKTEEFPNEINLKPDALYLDASALRQLP